MNPAALSCLVVAVVASGLGAIIAAEAPTSRDLQAELDAAPPFSLIRCDPNRPLTLTNPIVVRKPVSISGLHARLPDNLGNTSLLLIESTNVAFTDFELTGNGESVPQKDRAPLMIVRAGDFRIERGQFINSSKDGVMIDADTAKDDIVGGVVRDIVGRSVIRDTVSISGSGGQGRRIRNVLVDNVRCYDSRLRGAVEVSDGTDNITVRKVYAESAVYAIDVQDHNQPGQSNRNVVIQDIYAVRCKHALRTANTRKGHGNLTIRDVVAEQCEIPVQISHTENVRLEGVRVLNHTSGKQPIQIQNCPGTIVRDVLMQNVTVRGAGLLLENCPDVVVDGFMLRGATNDLSSAICYRLTTNDKFAGLRISNVSAREGVNAGIVLDRRKEGTLTDYLISGNLATVQDRIQGARGVVTNNLSW